MGAADDRSGRKGTLSTFIADYYWLCWLQNVIYTSTKLYFASSHIRLWQKLYTLYKQTEKNTKKMNTFYPKKLELSHTWIVVKVGGHLAYVSDVSPPKSLTNIILAL